jgi:hypothetical protein
MQKKIKKLVLQTERLRILTAFELAGVAAGIELGGHLEPVVLIESNRVGCESALGGLSSATCRS